MSETERNLKVAKECGAEVFDDEGFLNFDIIFKKSQLYDYTDRIFAERDAKVLERLIELHASGTKSMMTTARDLLDELRAATKKGEVK